MGYPAQCPWQAFLLLTLLRLTACRSRLPQLLFIKLLLKQLEQYRHKRQRRKDSPICCFPPLFWCPERESNPYGRNGQGILSPSCLPIPPSGRPLAATKVRLLHECQKEMGQENTTLASNFQPAPRAQTFFTFQNTRTLHREFRPETRAKTAIKHKKIEIMQNRAQKCFFVRHN